MTFAFSDTPFLEIANAGCVTITARIFRLLNGYTIKDTFFSKLSCKISPHFHLWFFCKLKFVYFWEVRHNFQVSTSTKHNVSFNFSILLCWHLSYWLHFTQRLQRYQKSSLNQTNETIWHFTSIWCRLCEVISFQRGLYLRP